MSIKTIVYDCITELNQLLKKEKGWKENEYSGMFFTTFRRTLGFNSIPGISLSEISKKLRPKHVEISVKNGQIETVKFIINHYYYNDWDEDVLAPLRGLIVNTNGAYDKVTLEIADIINSI